MLTPPAAADVRARWKKTILYRFKGQPDGSNPYSTLLGDGAGAYYGTTYLGGKLNYGTVFKIEPPAEGARWKLMKLTDFEATLGRGPLFYGALVRDENGVLYSTTAASAGIETIGTVFQLTPPTTGRRWRYKSLSSFPAGGPVGHTPNSALVRDEQGRLFGTTSFGGGANAAGVFMVKP